MQFSKQFAALTTEDGIMQARTNITIKEQQAFYAAFA
jgi:hypothetical protein